MKNKLTDMTIQDVLNIMKEKLELMKENTTANNQVKVTKIVKHN